MHAESTNSRNACALSIVVVNQISEASRSEPPYLFELSTTNQKEAAKTPEPKERVTPMTSFLTKVKAGDRES